MPTLRTLFSGGELFGVGARQAGYTHADGYELDPKIATVAQLNGFDVRVADVCAVDYAALPPVDHLHGSPSCKNASNANQPGTDENGDPLPRETEQDLACADAVCRAIAAHQGDTFTLENVYGYRVFESFDRIRAALSAAGFSYEYWHLNAADYGVPQTRKRLILIARRELCRIQRPNPTHRDGGDMFHPPWIGWYAAIEDILHTLPPTQPAPWQLARLPKEIRESMLIGAGGYDGAVVSRDIDEPAFTITHGGEGGTTGNSAQLRAFLVQSKNVSQQWGDGTRDEDEPAFSIVTDHKPSHMPKAFLVSNAKTEYGDGVRQADEPMLSVTTQMAGRARAYIVGGGNTQLGQIDSHARTEADPMFTVSASDGARKVAAAYLLDGDNGRPGTGEPTYRTADQPAATLRASRTTLHRAYTAGRWVRMTIQAFGRFQTVPDDYRGLTAEINGNGVPCEEARQIMLSVKG